MTDLFKSLLSLSRFLPASSSGSGGSGGGGEAAPSGFKRRSSAYVSASSSRSKYSQMLSCMLTDPKIVKLVVYVYTDGSGGIGKPAYYLNVSAIQHILNIYLDKTKWKKGCSFQGQIVNIGKYDHLFFFIYAQSVKLRTKLNIIDIR